MENPKRQRSLLSRGSSEAVLHPPNLCQDFFDRNDICVFRSHVEQVRPVRRLGPVSNALLRDDSPKAVLERVHYRCANTPAGRRPSDDEGVHPLRDELTTERRPEEGGRILFDPDDFAGSPS